MQNADNGGSDASQRQQPPVPPLSPKNETPSGNATISQGGQEAETAQQKLDRDMVKWTRAVALLTGALVFVGFCQIGAALLQWHEMHTGGVDTHNLAVATGNLADRARDQTSAMDKLRKAAEAQVRATSDLKDITAKQVTTLGGQQHVMQGQLREMQIEQRPWLSLNVAPATLSVVRGVPPDVIFEVNGVNVGKSPALDVTYSWFSHIPTGPESGSFADIANKGCSRFPMTGFAPILMPGEKYTQRLMIMFTNGDLEKAWAPVGEKDRKTFNSLIIVCATFRLAADKEPHLLAVVTEIDQLTPNRPVKFSFLGQYGD